MCTAMHGWLGRALTYPGFGLGFLEKTPGRLTVLKERTVVPSQGDIISYRTTRPRPPSLKERPSSLGGNWEPERRRLMSPGAEPWDIKQLSSSSVKLQNQGLTVARITRLSVSLPLKCRS